MHGYYVYLNFEFPFVHKWSTENGLECFLIGWTILYYVKQRDQIERFLKLLGIFLFLK